MNLFSPLKKFSPLGKREDSWSAYWLTHLSDEDELILRASGRNGLTIPATVGTAPSILLPFFKILTTSGYSTVTDNGALDVGATDFTLWGKCDMSATGTSGNRTISGKYIDVGTPPAGYYGLKVLPTNNNIYAIINPTGGAKSVQHAVNVTTLGWFTYRLEVDFTAMKFRFFINNVQSGADVAFTGTMPALDNKYTFRIGSGSRTDTGAVTAQSGPLSHADCIILNRKMTPTEAANAELGIFPTDCKAHWTCGNQRNINDVSGNGYHMTVSGTPETHITQGFSASGSQHQLKKGYTLYTRSGFKPFYVPHSDAGVKLGTPSVPASYVEGTDFAGSDTTYNLCDAMIQYTEDIWDRSNETRCSSYARVAPSATFVELTYYLSAAVKAWHISEHNNWVRYYYYNRSYQWQNFFKMTGKTMVSRSGGLEVYAYSSERTNEQAARISKYIDEYGYWLDYYFSDLHICTTRGNKQLAFDGTDTMSLSTDGGATFPISLQVVGMSAKVTYAYIWLTGEIMFCTATKCYYSDDNLATVNESTILDIEGNAFVPTADDNNFSPLTHDNYNPLDIPVFGHYSVGTAQTNLNAWYSPDKGVTLKSLYKSSGVSEFNHIHAINYIKQLTATTYEFIMQTGDDAGECNWYKAVYNSGTQAWTVTLFKQGNDTDWWKTTGMAHVGGFVYWPYDGINDPTKQGIWKAPYSSLNDSDTYTKIRTESDDIWNFIMGQDGEMVYTITTPTGQDKRIVTSIDGVTFVDHRLKGGVDFSGAQRLVNNITPKNTDRYYRAEIWATGELVMADIYKGQVVLFKIIKH